VSGNRKREKKIFMPQYFTHNVAWHTETGRRKANEDSCAVQLAPDGSACLLVVADGMGGHASGEIASRIAVDTLLGAFEAHRFHPEHIRPLLQDAIWSAHQEILRTGQQQPEQAGMGTTVVAAVLSDERVDVAHVGDSRALQFRGDEVRRLTRDHLYAIDVLGVDENRAKDHAQGNVLSQALGFEGGIDPTFNSFDLQAGDVIVLCSDGVCSHVSEPLMGDSLLTSHADKETHWSQVAADIVRHALLNGSRDNCTVVLAAVPQPDVAQPEEAVDEETSNAAELALTSGTDGDGT
jgi:protein phosphatase